MSQLREKTRIKKRGCRSGRPLFLQDRFSEKCQEPFRARRKSGAEAFDAKGHHLLAPRRRVAVHDALDHRLVDDALRHVEAADRRLAVLRLDGLKDLLDGVPAPRRPVPIVDAIALSDADAPLGRLFVGYSPGSPPH